MCIHIYIIWINNKYKFAFNFLIRIFEIPRIRKMQEVKNNMYIKVKFREEMKIADVKIFVSFQFSEFAECKLYVTLKSALFDLFRIFKQM